ncbi:MAG TPA: hypothetical protein VF974_05975 [Patescibacteria group bacterium]
MNTQISKPEPPVVQSIRFPRDLWNELQKKAGEGSFNKIVIRVLQAQIEQEKKEKAS